MSQPIPAPASRRSEENEVEGTQPGSFAFANPSNFFGSANDLRVTIDGDGSEDGGSDGHRSEDSGRRSMELPAGIHSGYVPVDALDMFWGGRGMGSGLEGSVSEIDTYTAVAPSVMRHALQDAIADGLRVDGLEEPLLPGRQGRSAHRTPARTPRRSRTPTHHLRRRSHPATPRTLSAPASEWSYQTADEEIVQPTPWWVKAAWGVGILAYLGAALWNDWQKAMPLVWFVGGMAGLWLAGKAWTRWCSSCITSSSAWMAEMGETGRLLQVALAWAVSLAVFITYIMLDVVPQKQWERLISLGGIGVFILVCLACSDSPKSVVWRPVFWGMASQLAIAGLTLKWSAGFKALNALGEGVIVFLSFAEEGAQFIYGDNYKDHYFAFVVLSIIIFFGSFLGVCYHLGLVQLLIDNISYLMSVTFKVSGVDAVAAVGNMFVGPCESALLVKPFLLDLTRSELQSLMITGMGSVSGGSLAAYISYGIPIDHVLVAVMLSAPCSIMVAKILCPEREESKAKEVQCPAGECTNVVEAAAQGAADCIPLVLNIGGIMLAFVSLLALMDALLGVLGSYVGMDYLSFNWLCSYGFRPFAFFMGVPWKDCGLIAELLGTRMFVSELVAYDAMGKSIEAGELSERAIMIGTYALCGFANLATVGVLLGGLSPLIPHRSQQIAGMSFRAIIGGTMTCLITGCVAGFVVHSI